MKNTLKITLVAFITLSLFACDSSSSNNSTGTAADTYFVKVNVNNLNGTLNLINGTEELIVTTPSSQAITTGEFKTKLKVDDLYDVQVNTAKVNNGQPTGLTCDIPSGSGKMLASDVVIEINCKGGGGGSNLVGSKTKGRIYYESECAVCHRAGADDLTYTFGSNDVAKDYQFLATKAEKDAYITTDMHFYGPKATTNPNLMGRFDKVPAQSVADLKAYLISVTVP